MDIEYAPKPDGRPDPREVVWTWVSSADDPRRGKDRPVLRIDPAEVLGAVEMKVPSRG